VCVCACACFSGTLVGFVGLLLVCLRRVCLFVCVRVCVGCVGVGVRPSAHTGTQTTALAALRLTPRMRLRTSHNTDTPLAPGTNTYLAVNRTTRSGVSMRIDGGERLVKSLFVDKFGVRLVELRVSSVLHVLSVLSVLSASSVLSVFSGLCSMG